MFSFKTSEAVALFVAAFLLCSFEKEKENVMADDDKNPPKVVAPKSLLPEIQNQYAFIKDYVNSPKYKERLARMVNTERNLQQPINPQPFTNEVFAGSQTNAPTPEVVNNVVTANNEALQGLNGKISVSDVNLGNNVAGGYDSAYNDIRMNQGLVEQNPTVPAHEISHAINDGRQPYSPAFDEKYLRKVFIPPTNSRFEGEVQKPTEVKARLDAVRFLGQKTGLYDAGKKEFTPADYDKLIKNKEISNDYNFKQILDQLPKNRKKTGFIWLMNNIAKVGNEPIDPGLA